MGKKKAEVLGIVAGLCATAAAAIYFRGQNNDIMITELTCRCPKLPEAFEGYNIAHVSDLHGKMFGQNQKDLISLIKKQKPDMIAVTGDVVDRMHTNIGAVTAFVRQAVKIAPVYYVPGNHEADFWQYPRLLTLLREAGVAVLDNKKEVICRGDAAIEIVGVADPLFYTRRRNNVTQAYYMRKNIRQALDDDTVADGNVRILLSHRPEHIDVYKRYNIDLVLAGHAHGGQWRIPGVGGLFAPDQGIMPTFTSGMHTVGDTALVISRGLGNSAFPLRIANRVELVAVTLTNVQQA